MSAMSQEGNLSCDCCGACCRTFPILVSIGDARREPRIVEEAMELPEWQQNEEWNFKLHPLPFLSGCPFLQPDNRCGVYETRPSPCRRFSAGSSECVEARRRVGLAPLPGSEVAPILEGQLVTDFNDSPAMLVRDLP